MDTRIHERIECVDIMWALEPAPSMTLSQMPPLGRCLFTTGVDSAPPVLHEISGNNSEELATASPLQQRSCLHIGDSEGDKKLQSFVLIN